MGDQFVGQTKWITDNNWRNLKVTSGIVVLVAIAVGSIFLLRYSGIGGIQVPSQPNSFWISICWWAIVTLVAFVLLNIFYFATSRLTTIVLDAAMLFSIFWGVASGAAVLLTIFFLYSDPVRQTHAFLSAAGGGIAGWLLGMYFSPKDSSEKQEFGKIQAAVAAIASGYTLKGVIDFASKPGNEHYHLYMTLATIMAALTTATIYNVRAYDSNKVRISFDKVFSDPANPRKVKVKVGDVVLFKAAVDGPDDTSVAWSLLPDPKTGKAFGSIVAGKYTAGLDGVSPPADCRVKAESVENPAICDVVDITISA